MKAAAFFAIALAALAPVRAEEAGAPEITVFAAASLADVLGEAGREFTRESGVAVRFSFAASSALARQIEAGAPADAFVSADLEWMDYLEERSLVDGESRRNVAGNALVLIAPRESAARIEIAPGMDLSAVLGGGRLAIADPDSVPAGRYARAALVSLRAWKGVESRLAPAENVRAALAFVSRAEASLGIVYRTDAAIDPRVRVIGVFPAGTHPPIVYPAAAVARGKPAGTAFVVYLSGAEARATFGRHGFTPAPSPAPLPAQGDAR
jgi:molybdate transport system substrate-binding protein